MTNTIDDQITPYLSAIGGNRSPKTRSTYATVLKMFSEIVGGDTPLTTDAYIAFLKKTTDMAPRTQALCRSAIRGLMAYHGADHPEDVNILAMKNADRMYGLQAGKRLVVFDRDAIEQVIKYAAEHKEDIIALRDRAFVLTMVDSGLRISEACSLKRGDIDWREGRAMVIGKGDKQAVVYLSERAMDALRDYLRERAAMDGASGKQPQSLPLFARHDDGVGKKVKPVQSHGMWAAVKQLAQRAGIDETRLRVHDFRHYFVTMIYLETGDIKAAQVLARHEDIGTTDRYTHIGGKIEEIYHEVFNKQSR